MEPWGPCCTWSYWIHTQVFLDHQHRVLFEGVCNCPLGTELDSWHGSHNWQCTPAQHYKCNTSCPHDVTIPVCIFPVPHTRCNPPISSTSTVWTPLNRGPQQSEGWFPERPAPANPNEFCVYIFSWPTCTARTVILYTRFISWLYYSYIIASWCTWLPFGKSKVSDRGVPASCTSILFCSCAVIIAIRPVNYIPGYIAFIFVLRLFCKKSTNLSYL